MLELLLARTQSAVTVFVAGLTSPSQFNPVVPEELYFKLVVNRPEEYAPRADTQASRSSRYSKTRHYGVVVVVASQLQCSKMRCGVDRGTGLEK